MSTANAGGTYKQKKGKSVGRFLPGFFLPVFLPVFFLVPLVFLSSLFLKGPAKKKRGTPVVGGWVRVQIRIRVRFIFFDIFYRVFELPSSRNAQKRDKRNSRKSRFWIFGRYFCKKLFYTIFFVKRFL
jgi:hypothetical protein